jgi:adenylate cyclase
MKNFSLFFSSKLTKYLPSFVGLIIALSFAYYAMLTPIQERIIDWKAYDFYTRYYPQTESNHSIVIIDIDDQSIESIGQWPWPRFRLAQALRLINEGRPSSILMDILLSEKDRSSLINLQQLFDAEFAVNLDLSTVPQGLIDNDSYLSQVIDGAPVVLPSVLTENKVYNEGLCTNKYIGQLNIGNVSNDKPSLREANDQLLNLNDKQYQGIICPLETFYQHSASTGFINATIDKDGLVRRMPILKQYNDQIIPNVSLALLTVLLGTEFDLDKDSVGPVVRVNNYQIPIDIDGNALLNFRGKGRHYQTIPMLKLLSGSIPSDYFTGKIVLFGATASAMNDIVSTHLDPVFPGIEAHATLIDNVLNNDLLSVPVWFEKLEMLLIMLFGVVLSLLMLRERVIVFNAVAICILIMLAILPAILLYHFQLYLSPFLAIVSLISMYIVMSTLKHYIAEKHLVSVLSSMSEANLSIIDSMATVAELRDCETGGHITRTRLYVKALIEHLQTKQKYIHQINDDYIKFLCAAAPLHDIGKVGIPDHILLKPGKLTVDEFVIMKTHAALGGDILRQTIKKVGANPYLNIAIEIANYHHEKWDGSGYPLGLKGDSIPLSARVMAISDVFDALINKRIYKDPVSFDDTLNYIKQASGTHFDPDIVEAFCEIKEELFYIAQTIDD